MKMAAPWWKMYYRTVQQIAKRSVVFGELAPVFVIGAYTRLFQNIVTLRVWQQTRPPTSRFYCPQCRLAYSQVTSLPAGQNESNCWISWNGVTRAGRTTRTDLDGCGLDCFVDRTELLGNKAPKMAPKCAQCEIEGAQKRAPTERQQNWLEFSSIISKNTDI